MSGSATTTTVLEATDLLFNHDRSGPPQVDGVSFKLRAGKTLGVLGGNECGKTTLAQLLLGTLKPQRGAVALHLGSTTSTTPRWLVIARAALALLVAALAAVGAPLVRAGGWAPALLLALLEAAQRLRARYGVAGAEIAGLGWAPAAMRRRGVAYASSEHDAGPSLPAQMSVEELIGRHMPLPASDGAGRRREVLAALKAIGFQMYKESGVPWGTPEEYLEQGLACGELSGGQKQMVYILAVLASRPKLLICDEVLCGLDVDRQASALQMLQKLQVETGMAILYLSVDLQAVQLMAHAAAFMEKGRLVEHQDDAHALFDAPREQPTRVYLHLAREIQERARGRDLTASFQRGESVFTE